MLLRQFSSRPQNEIVFIEKTAGLIPRDSIAAKILQNCKRFWIEEVSATVVEERPTTKVKNLAKVQG